MILTDLVEVLLKDGYTLTGHVNKIVEELRDDGTVKKEYLIKNDVGEHWVDTEEILNVEVLRTQNYTEFLQKVEEKYKIKILDENQQFQPYGQPLVDLLNDAWSEMSEEEKLCIVQLASWRSEYLINLFDMLVLKQEYDELCQAEE